LIFLNKMLYEINDPEFIAMVEKGVPIDKIEKRMRPKLGIDDVRSETEAHDSWLNYSREGF